ncbi:MAG: serine/threonine protein kinase [Gemmatimonadaceae bacterium]|nr:serine/threonine protein kinase [Gemmatimonadaceae bacterium]
MSDADSLRRLRQLFDEVSELPPAKREAWLAAHDADDPALARELRALLAHDDRTDARLQIDHLVAGTTPDDAVGDALDESRGRIGPYETQRLVGRGGMGAVYEAIRADDQYRKRVAIKVVRGAIATDLTLARFRRERQILASLEHRNIATLLDGGVTPAGQPFLVMEFVEGEPFTTWCDARALSVSDRLQLFRQVCAAVRHAHGRLIVHRDLKPGNILVTGDGSVKLLDFGIARLLAGADDDGLPATEGSTRAFTPEYASPEQIRGDAPTTASDVYALGVVLYELVAGRRPFVRADSELPVEQRILQDDAPSSSSVATDQAAALRSERNAERLRRRLRGDIDVIVRKALQREPERRYSTVDALDEDIRRHLTGLPITARPERWYRARRFARRYRGTVVAAAAILLALLGGVITTTRQARLARAEQVKSAEVAGFLRALLESVKPATGGRDVPVSEVLEAAARRVDDEDVGNIDVREELEMVIANSFQSLGRLDDAEKHFQHARTLVQQREGNTGPSMAMVLNSLGGVELTRGALPRAESLFTHALRLRERASASSTDSMTAVIMSNLGSVAHARGDESTAVRFHRSALEEKRRIFGPTSDSYAYSLGNVAVGVGEQGRLAEAESLHREVLRIVRSNHPGLHPIVADAENSLASVLDFEGKTVEADSLYASVVAARRKLLGAEHPDYAFTAMNYAAFLFDQKRYDEARNLATEIVTLRGRSLPESHPAIAASLQTVGRSLTQLGRHAEGRAALEESLALRRKYAGENSWLVASSQSVLGEHYAMTGDYPRAEALLLHADSALKAILGAENPRVKMNQARLAVLYGKWKRTPR